MSSKEVKRFKPKDTNQEFKRTGKFKHDDNVYKIINLHDLTKSSKLYKQFVKLQIAAFPKVSIKGIKDIVNGVRKKIGYEKERGFKHAIGYVLVKIGNTTSAHPTSTEDTAIGGFLLDHKENKKKKVVKFFYYIM